MVVEGRWTRPGALRLFCRPPCARASRAGARVTGPIYEDLDLFQGDQPVGDHVVQKGQSPLNVLGLVYDFDNEREVL